MDHRIRVTITDQRLLITDYGSPITQYRHRSPITDHCYRSPITDHRYRSPIVDHRLRNTDYGSPIMEHRLRITDYGSPVKRHRWISAYDLWRDIYHTTAEGAARRASAGHRACRIRVGGRTREGVRRPGCPPIDPRQENKTNKVEDKSRTTCLQ